MKRKYIALFLFVISFSYLFMSGCHSDNLTNREKNDMETKQDKEINETGKYPKYFEIVKNDGKELKVKIGEMVPGSKSYYYRLFKNGKKVVRFNKVNDNGVIATDITETGKYTFMIFLNDEVHRVGPSWRIITNPIKKLINRIFRNPVWAQDVFVVKPDKEGLSSPRIKELAAKYAPFLFLDAEERYLPASINFLLNKENPDEELNNIKLTLKFRHTRKAKVVRRTPFTGVAMNEINEILYKDLDKVLPYNGDNISVLDTIGTNPVDLVKGKTFRDYLEGRTENKDNVTVYYSFFPNPNQEKKEVIINYHFLYIYDSKTEAEEETKKASHIFDRESISIIFKWDKSNPDVDPQPKSVVYGAHLPGQLITLKREDKGEEQKWKTRRVKVEWNDAHKIEIGNNKESHPIVAIAKGSHATYPVPGNYAVKPHKFLPESVEPAEAGKALIPYDYEGSKSKIEELFDGDENVNCYKLVDLELGSIKSSSPNSILAFSGYIVDIIGLTDAKFPPFTERETDIEDWVNGTKKDPLHNWDPDKVDQKTKDELEKLVKDIGKHLTKEAISKKPRDDSGGEKT